MINKFHQHFIQSHKKFFGDQRLLGGMVGITFLMLMSLISCSNLNLLVTPETVITPFIQTDVPPEVPSLQSTAPIFVSGISGYAFPASIDLSRKYLFYLHGKIIEEQGIPAISPDFGEYEYGAILQKFASYGFIVISEQRSKNTDGVVYAKKVAEQIEALLGAGIPAEKITVVGASKGAGIVIYISHFLKNEAVNFVIMGICQSDEAN